MRSAFPSVHKFQRFREYFSSSLLASRFLFPGPSITWLVTLTICAAALVRIESVVGEEFQTTGTRCDTYILGIWELMWSKE